MGVDWEFLRILRKPREPKVEPCSKDAGCVPATGGIVMKESEFMEKVNEIASIGRPNVGGLTNGKRRESLFRLSCAETN